MIGLRHQACQPNLSEARAPFMETNLTDLIRNTVYALASLIVPCVSYGGALVTLTSPTESPTRVLVGAFAAPSQEFKSVDTTPFDRTASAFDGTLYYGGRATAHLTLNATPEEIRSSLDAESLGQGYWRSSFSIDIMVNVLTPFVLEVQASSVTNASYYSYGFSDVKYRLYTPDSNGLDVSFISPSNGGGVSEEPNRSPD
jgi:hypothetical protein